MKKFVSSIMYGPTPCSPFSIILWYQHTWASIMLLLSANSHLAMRISQRIDRSSAKYFLSLMKGSWIVLRRKHVTLQMIVTEMVEITLFPSSLERGQLTLEGFDHLSLAPSLHDMWIANEILQLQRLAHGYRAIKECWSQASRLKSRWEISSPSSWEIILWTRCKHKLHTRVGRYGAKIFFPHVNSNISE